MEAIIKVDKNGKAVFPSKVLERFPSKEILLRESGDHYDLIPLPDPKSLRGKYKLDRHLDDIEESQEEEILKRG